MIYSGFKKHIFAFLMIALPLCGLWHIGQGAYIQAKAALAQFLLESAWAETLQGQKEVKPWPWADIWPVGQLSVPRLGLSRIVLAGASGEALAFGPGRLFQTHYPEMAPHTVIAGHRDTHFRFLRYVKNGDRLVLHTHNGDVHHYTVIDIRVLHVNDFLPYNAFGKTLTLLTCYPFEAILPGGPLRLAVTASRVKSSRPGQVRL